MDHVVQDPLSEHAHAEGQGPSSTVSASEGSEAVPTTSYTAGDELPPPPRITRADPGASPARMKKDAAEPQDERHGRLKNEERMPYSPSLLLWCWCGR